jgi:hypothetical protein
MGDEKAEKELEMAGLDPDPCGWYLKFVLRNGQTAVFVASSFDKNRLAHNLLNNGSAFFVFSSADREVVVNLRHVLFAHTLFQEPAVENRENLESIRVHLSLFAEPLTFHVSAHLKTDVFEQRRSYRNRQTVPHQPM